MGIWRDISTSVRHNALAEREAHLAMMLADRAAGKGVRDQDIVYYRTSIELDRIYLDNNAKLDAQEAHEQRQRSAATQAFQVANNEQWKERRRQQREAVRQARDNFRERVAEHEKALLEEMAEHSDVLDRMHADDESLTRDDLIKTLIFSTSLLVQEDADQLGPIFGQVRRWVMDREDPDGVFSTSAAANQLDPDTFPEEINYREAIAAAVAGDGIIEAALASWDPLKKSGLALKYPDFNANLHGVDGPAYDDSLGGWYLWHNEKLNTLVFNELDTTQWEHHRLFSLPIPSDAPNDLSGHVIEHGACQSWAMDAERTYFLLGRQLYALGEGQFKKVSQLQLDGLDIFSSGARAEAIPSTWQVRQQLVVIDGRPVWSGAVIEKDSELTAGSANGGDRARKPQEAYVSIDLSTNQMMWLSQGTDEYPPGTWQFDSSSRTWLTFSVAEVAVAAVTASPAKGGFLQRFFRSEREPVKPETRREYYINERDALTGAELRRVRINLDGWISGASVRFDNAGRLSLWGLNTRYGFFDRSTLDYVPDKLEVEAEPLGSVGDSPLHVLQQTLRFHGGRRDEEGELLPSAVRVVII